MFTDALNLGKINADVPLVEKISFIAFSCVLPDENLPPKLGRECENQI
jgi:hypothetical protein